MDVIAEAKRIDKNVSGKTVSPLPDAVVKGGDQPALRWKRRRMALPHVEGIPG